MKAPKGPIFFEKSTLSWCGMSADDAVVVSLTPSSSTSRLCRWDTRTGECLSVASAKEYCPRAAAVSPAGDRMAAVGTRLWLFDSDGSLLTKAPAWVKDNEDATSVAFSPDGSLVAAVAEKTSFTLPIVVWEVATGKERLRSCVAPMIIAERPNIGGRQLAFSPDGRSLIVWTDDSRAGASVAVRIDVGSGASHALGADAPELEWMGRSLDGTVVRSHGLVASRPAWGVPSITVTDASGARYELRSRPRDWVSPPQEHHLPGQHHLSYHGFSPSGRFLCAVASGELHVWDMATGARVADPRAR